MTAREKIGGVEVILEKQSRGLEAAIERLEKNGNRRLANELRERLEELHSELHDEHEREREHEHEHGEHAHDWDRVDLREKKEIIIELKEKLERIAAEAEKAKRSGNRAEAMELREMSEVILAEIYEIQGKKPAKEGKVARAKARARGKEMLRDLNRRLAQAEKDGDERLVDGIKRRIEALERRMSQSEDAHGDRSRKRKKERPAKDSKGDSLDHGESDHGERDHDDPEQERGDEDGERNKEQRGDG